MLQTYNPRNADIQVWVGDRLYHRNEAHVSVFDSVVQGGDSVWEGLRVYDGQVFVLDRHLDRLYESAASLAFEGVPSREFITKAVFETLKANGMYDEAHVRLSLTRGTKVTSGMDPRLNQNGCTLIVLAEWKALVYDNDSGIKVITTQTRRNSPMFLDSKIHHNNLLNNILAKIEANKAGVDAGLMLDEQGYVSELNDTNLFMVKDGALFTPYPRNCLAGITRGLVIEIAEELDIPVAESDMTPEDYKAADDVFATGTMGELTPVVEIDGRAIIGNSSVRQSIHKAFTKKRKQLGIRIV